MLDADDALVAYRCFGTDAQVASADYRADALNMGRGLRPDLTRRGFGPAMMHAAMTFAQVHFAPRAFRVTAALWNNGAQWACRKVGDQLVSSFVSPHATLYVIMLWPTPALICC